MAKVDVVTTTKALEALDLLDEDGQMASTQAYHTLLRYIHQQDRRALSHAAGQDGEQCRAASVASGEAEELAQWLDAKFKRHGEIEDKRAAELLRALSRGVPEGETVPKILMRAVKAANSAGAESLADDILSLMDAHWPTSDAAIAAQRKEGPDA